MVTVKPSWLDSVSAIIPLRTPTKTTCSDYKLFKPHKDRERNDDKRLHDDGLIHPPATNAARIKFNVLVKLLRIQTTKGVQGKFYQYNRFGHKVLP